MTSVELPPTFDALQKYITPTPSSPSLPEDQSDFTSTPDCNLFMRQRGACMVMAVACKAIQHEPEFARVLLPASVNVIEQCGPFMRELAKHDNPSEAINTGGVLNWVSSSVLSWTMWWRHKETTQMIFNFTREQWAMVYKHATEAEKAHIFCIKPVSRRPSRTTESIHSPD